MLDCLIREFGPPPRHALVWLHGLGADGHDFEPMFEALRLPPALGLRVVLPHAPVRAVTINGGARMRTWYDFRAFVIGQGEAAEGVWESVAQVQALLRAERARLHTGGKLMLGGFSQGGVITLAAGLRADPPLHGLLALSAYLWGDVPEVPPQVPVFLAHGEYDPVIPQEYGLAAYRALRAAGVEVDWHGYPMGHAVCPEEISDLAAWLTRKLGA